MAGNGERWHFPNEADAEGEHLPNLRSGELEQGDRPSGDAVAGAAGSDLQPSAGTVSASAASIESLENIAGEALMQDLKKGAARLGIFSVFDLRGKHTYAAFQNLLPAPRVVSPLSMWNRAASMSQSANRSLSKLNRS
ncbi:hypothetical protein [Varibaculum prostatecancerukia]|uniref:hypothetical protein n=1 Tax=Varibaculum prostatecancerukia TaxID=2811781 RepID=UPI001BFFF3DD|nr:hypothetical protein [Varibaculum prostatecancerukia]